MRFFSLLSPEWIGLLCLILYLSFQWFPPLYFCSVFFCLCHRLSLHWHPHMQLSNGFDHYSPASSPYLHSNGGGTAFPFFPAPPSSTTSSSSPTRSRPASALLPDHPPYCTLGPMIPSSRVPSWKVCFFPSASLVSSFASCLSGVWIWLMLTSLCWQDWAKPGPYDQPMVNTLRRRKDKETTAVVDTNSSVINDSGPTLTSAQATAVLQTSVLMEERNKTVKVCFSHMLFHWQFWFCLFNTLSFILIVWL